MAFIGNTRGPTLNFSQNKKGKDNSNNCRIIKPLDLEFCSWPKLLPE